MLYIVVRHLLDMYNMRDSVLLTRCGWWSDAKNVLCGAQIDGSSLR
jgi:hypothetical protein